MGAKFAMAAKGEQEPRAQVWVDRMSEQAQSLRRWSLLDAGFFLLSALASAWFAAAAFEWTGSVLIAMAAAVAGVLLPATLLILLQVALGLQLGRRGELDPPESIWDPLPRRHEALMAAMIVGAPVLLAPLVYAISASLGASLAVLIVGTALLWMFTGSYVRYMEAPPDADEATTLER